MASSTPCRGAASRSSGTSSTTSSPASDPLDPRAMHAKAAFSEHPNFTSSNVNEIASTMTADALADQIDVAAHGALGVHRSSWTRRRQRKWRGKTRGGSSTTTSGEIKTQPAGKRYGVPRIRDSGGQCRAVVTGDRVCPIDEHGPVPDGQMGIALPWRVFAARFSYVDTRDEGLGLVRISNTRRDGPGRWLSARHDHGVRATEVVCRSRACESASRNTCQNSGYRYPPSDLHHAPSLRALVFASAGDPLSIAPR